MFQKLLFRSMASAFAAAILPATAHADSITHGATVINMDFVSIGNPGNAGDTTGTPNPCGSVGYVYRIGKYEVTEDQWDAVVAADGSDLLDDPGYWSGDQPVTEISWHEMAMFCNWLTSGNVMQGAYAVDGSGQVTGIDRDGAVNAYGTVYVIPTENEWYKAAYYDPNKGGAGVPGYWDYPTKHDDPDRPDGINYDGDTAFDAVFADFFSQGHPNDVRNAGVLSPYGTMGQGGNVWERNETAIGSLARYVRGGDWGNNPLALAATYHVPNTLNLETYYLGFRVASIPEPGAGDANNDDVVDDKDASILGANWMRTGAEWADGDFNGDHVVNDKDASILAAHWGWTQEAGASVPEPSTAASLLGLIVAAIAAWRRRRD